MSGPACVLFLFLNLKNCGTNKRTWYTFQYNFENSFPCIWWILNWIEILLQLLCLCGSESAPTRMDNTATQVSKLLSAEILSNFFPTKNINKYLSVKEVNTVELKVLENLFYRLHAPESSSIWMFIHAHLSLHVYDHLNVESYLRALSSYF